MEINRIRRFIGVLLIGFLLWIPIAQAQVSDFPELTLTTMAGSVYPVSGPGAKILLFFDAASHNNSDVFQLLNKIAYSFRGSDLQIIAAYSDLEPMPAALLAEFKQKNSLAFPLYLDRDRLALKKFAIPRAPAIFIGDRQGKIIYHKLDTKVGYYPLVRHVKYALGVIDAEALRLSLTAQGYLPPLKMPLAAETRIFTEAAATGSTRPEDKQPQQSGEKQPPVVVQPGEKPPPPGEKPPPPGEKQPPVVAQPGEKPPQPGEKPPPPDEKQPPVLAQPGERPPQPGEKQPAVVARPAEKQPPSLEKQPPAAAMVQSQKTVSKPLAAALLPDTFGYKPYQWGLAKDMRSMVLALGADLLIKLLPLFIWGWAILYLLAKLTKYRGMLCGLFAATGMLCLSLIHFSMEIPFQLCILSSHLWQWKTLVLHYYQMLAPYPLEKTLYLVLQLALLRALAGRFKKEQEVIA